SIITITRHPIKCTIFPYTTLFRSLAVDVPIHIHIHPGVHRALTRSSGVRLDPVDRQLPDRVPVAHDEPGELPPVAQDREGVAVRSEEHTSELQSRFDIVCRLLLEK